MIKRTVNFNIDANQISNTMLSYQGEHLATELRIHLPEKLLSSDCTYKLSFVLPNGESEYAILDYSNEYLKFLVPQALTLLSGEIHVQLTISSENVITKSYTQSYTIPPSLNDPIKEVDDKFVGLLESKIAEVDKIIAEGIETAQGKSAFEIAVENGFEGTVEEWIESLKGADGRGITSTEINASGELVLTYSDDSTANVGIVKGKDGTDYVLTESDKQEIAKLVEVSSGSSDKWELINTVEVNEEVNVVSITKDQSGNPFKLKKIRILGKIMPCVDQKTTNALALGLNSNISNIWQSNACMFGESPIATDTCENFILIGEIVRGYFSILECRHSYTRTNVTTLLSKSTARLSYPEQYQIGDAIIIGSYLKCIGIGSTFKIWGVKDNE